MEEVVVSSRPAVKKKYLQLLLSYGVTAIFVYFLIKNIDVHHLVANLANISLPFLLMGLGALVLAYLARSIRWGLMLQALNKDVKLSHCIAPFVVSMAVNNILPLRAGDFMRLFGFKSLHHLTPAEVLSTLMLERLLDLLMVLSLFFISLPWVTLHTIPPHFVHSIQLLTLFSALLLLILIGMPNYSKRVLNKVGQINFIKSKAIGQKLLDYIHRFIDSIQLIRSTRLFFTLVGLSILAWACEGSIYLVSAFACGYKAAWIGPYFASTLGTLSTLIPSSPGYIGTFDYFTMLGFQAFGVAQQTGTTIAVLVHMILWLPVTIVGIIFYFTNRSCRLTS